MNDLAFECAARKDEDDGWIIFVCHLIGWACTARWHTWFGDPSWCALPFVILVNTYFAALLPYCSWLLFYEIAPEERTAMGFLGAWVTGAALLLCGLGSALTAFTFAVAGWNAL